MRHKWLVACWLLAAPVWAQSLQSTQEPDGDNGVNWTCTGASCGTGHWTAVDDDETAELVSMDGAAGTTERFTTSDNSFAGTISYVRLRVHGRRGENPATGTCRIYDGANWCGTVAIPEGDPDWGTATVDYSTDCGGGAWEDSELDAIEIECQNGVTNKEIQVAWTDVEIWGSIPGAGVAMLVDGDPINSLVNGGLAR